MHNKLHKTINTAELIMLAISGTIGSGIFLFAIAPYHITFQAIIMTSTISAMVLFVIMKALTILSIDYPNSGSFTEYATIQLNSNFGFLSGWYTIIIFSLVAFVGILGFAHVLSKTLVLKCQLRAKI